MITTVIPTFERSKMLKRAIESALAQDIEGQQICVHDNASSDDTEKVVEEYCKRDGRVRYFRNPVNIGAQKNIYNGIVAVETPYYSVLSDDDFLLPGFYRKAIDCFCKFPDSAFVCAKTFIVDIENKRFERKNMDWRSGYYNPSSNISQKMYSSHFVSTGVLFSQKVKEKLGAFDLLGSDSLYMTLASSVFPFSVIDYYGAAVILHSSAYSMIEEGLNKEKISALNESFLNSISMIINQDITDDRKINLLMIYFSRLNQIFDSKRLMYHLRGVSEEAADLLFSYPLFITNRGFVDLVYRKVPALFRPIVKILYFTLYRINRIINKSVGGSWRYLEQKTYDRLLNLDKNVWDIDFDN